MKIEGTPSIILYPQIASELATMVKVDQEMREKNLSDPEHWDDEVDKRNTERMRQIISEIGWPSVSKVGKSGANDAWLLVQHSDHDPAFQRQCLELMKALPENEVEKRDVAYLEDRVLLKETGFQTYGTQFDQTEGKHVPKPISEPENVDERRNKMGLGKLEDGIKNMYEKYGTPEEAIKHEIFIFDKLLSKIESGEKTIEVRTAYLRFKNIKPGDTIEFKSRTKSVTVTVNAVRKYADLDAVKENEDINKISPGMTPAEVERASSEIFIPSDVEKYGVLVIEFKKIN